MAVTENIRALVEPLVAAQGLELFDVEHAGGVLKVTVEREGGADMDAIAKVTRSISRALDDHDPIAGRYTLEVSSPGLERNLRTPAHLRWAVGKKVNIKTTPDYDGERRLIGTITDADGEGVVVSLDDAGVPVRLRYDDLEKARTVFEWGGAPKPGASKKQDPPKRGSNKPGSPKTKRAKAS